MNRLSVTVFMLIAPFLGAASPSLEATVHVLVSARILRPLMVAGGALLSFSGPKRDGEGLRASMDLGPRLEDGASLHLPTRILVRDASGLEAQLRVSGSQAAPARALEVGLELPHGLAAGPYTGSMDMVLVYN